MSFQNLHRNEIYPLPIDGGYLVYAPLSGLFFRLQKAEVDRMEAFLGGSNSDDREVASLMDTLRSESKSSRTIPRKNDIGQLHKLTILPTYRCNFKCSYCYSAYGRQNKSLSWNRAVAAIDFFIDRNRTTLNELWLAILGGGEPFLSPDLTCNIISHARQRSHDQGFKLGIGLTTNGSIYNASLCKAMVDNSVNLGVSFEVLKDVQNAQRQSYDTVVPVVQRYMQEGVDITVKSIITPDNVNRLEEMVMELHRLFPQVKKYKLQIVEDPVIFADRAVMRKFYDDFSSNFFVAQKLGFSYGIDVYVLASKYLDMLVEHYCGGEMCLNPEGGVTVCHRYSSLAESNYRSFVYGFISEDGEITFDKERFAQLMSHDINHSDKCSECFVKWHCGGGCLAQSSIYQPDQLEIICEWTRSFTKQILLRQLANSMNSKSDL